MLLRLGVVAFEAWCLSGLTLVATAPACWFLGPRLVWLHLTLVACHFGVGLAVATQAYIPPGSLDGYGLYAIALRNWINGPLLIADVVATALRVPSRIGLTLTTGLAVATISAALATAATPAWLAAVPGRLIAQARAQAGTDPFCIAVGHQPVRGASDLSVSTMMVAAFARGVEYHWYYAVLVVARRGARPTSNWSFTSLRFEPMSPYFADLKPDCDPAANPL